MVSLILKVNIIAVGGLKESWLTNACAEYQKRLGAFCKLDITEVDEYRLGQNPSLAEIDKALAAEGGSILAKLPKKAFVAALCIEGTMLSSTELAEKIDKVGVEAPQLCFIIGGSHGLSGEVKSRADIRFSMSPMTFPHQLARVMLLEQLYRAFSIIAGLKYHK